eukprot:CAMPEP_0177584764 /NCGR_PEP_ID=MMETSP0419_2-20121207/4092_1 /TAXON_ID=582737 /ORGANISM="Tetraselmis sp., Strain GSL018" /LENGTH=674 /DNA_ID=CAMNT_0019074369 /DNA_START=191 /DNA_END=2216 /DNA_ORIENTATION=+
MYVFNRCQSLTGRLEDKELGSLGYRSPCSTRSRTKRGFSSFLPATLRMEILINATCDLDTAMGWRGAFPRQAYIFGSQHQLLSARSRGRDQDRGTDLRHQCSAADSAVYSEGDNVRWGKHLFGELESQLNRQEFRRASNTLLELCDQDIIPSAGNSMETIIGLCRLGMAERAKSLFSRLSGDGVQFEYSDHHELIQALIKSGHHGLAIRAFSELVAAGFSPNVITYCLLISGCAKAAKAKGRTFYGRMAYELWERLERSGKPLDPRALRIGLNACVMHGKVDMAEQIFRRLDKLGELDSRACNILLKGYAARGDAAKADSIVDMMRSREIPLDHAEGLRLRGDAGQRARAAGPDVGDGRAAQRDPSAPVVRAMAAHDRGRALAFMESLAGMGVATNAALWNNFLSGAYERDGMALMEALQQIARMGATGAKPNTDTFNILMSGCCRMDEPWGAKALFDRMKAEGVPPDALSYTTLMGALVQAGKLEQAIEAFQSLEADPRVEPDMAALNMLAYAYSRLDCMEDAIGVLDRIDSLAALEERAPSARGYGAVVAAFAQKNLPEGVFQIMQRFRSVGGVPDELMYNSVVRMCVRNRDWKRALRIAKVMELRGYSPDREVLTRMIQAVDQQLEEIELVPGQATQVKNRRFNEGLERFKFWLGLPNSYYNASWDWDDEE